MRFVIDSLFTAIPDFARDQRVDIHLEKLVERAQLRDTLVYVNGDPVACTKTPKDLVQLLRKARRKQIIP